MANIKYSFQNNVEVERNETDICFNSKVQRFRYKNSSLALCSAIELLSGHGAELNAMEDYFIKHHGTSSLPQLYYTLKLLYKKGILKKTIMLDGEGFACCEPITTGVSMESPLIDCDKEYLLSRFAHSRRDGEAFILESPLSIVQFTLHHWGAHAVIGLMAKKQSAQQLSESLGLPLETILSFLSELVAAGIITAVKTNNTPVEDDEINLKQWAFHDLLFHWASRSGAHSKTIGATYRFEEEIEPLPAHKQMSYIKIVDLHKPDMELLRQNDLSLAASIEGRGSIREYGENPVSLKELGELTYRCCRTQSVSPVDLDKGWKYEVSKRPYPCGGATYEQEVYFCVNDCHGLEPGLYHYDPLNHQLGLLSVRTKFVDSLLQDAAWSGIGGFPQVLMMVTARFPRVMWKYESIAYSLILKNAGFMLDHICLSAEAMNLASCVIGTGNSHSFAQMTDIPMYQESPVAEVALGSRK